MYTPEVFLALSPVMIFLCALAWKNEWAGFDIISTFASIICVLVFFISSGSVFNRDTRAEPVKVEMVKTSRVVFVDDGIDTYEFEGLDALEDITDSTQFYRIFEKNFWGIEAKTGLGYNLNEEDYGR